MLEQAILRAREELREGPHVIGWALGVAASTVQAVLRRHGRSRLVVRASREEIVCYERSRPGESSCTSTSRSSAGSCGQATAYPYANESERLSALAPALDFYDRFRPHRALRGLAPLQRVNNLPGTYT